MISSFILLGRITDADELSTDKTHWQTLVDLPALIPEVMRHVETEEDRQRLLIAQMHADERLAEGRRHGSAETAPGHDAPDTQGKRVIERRAAEPNRFRIHRHRREQLARPIEAPTRHPLLGPLLLGGVILLLFGLLFFYLRHPDAVVTSAPDCAAPATPGVNWSYCHMEGAQLARAQLTGANLSNASLVGADLQGAHLSTSDLSYANVSAANLHAADLRTVNLKGAELRNADLSGSILNDANLSYANLLGANLSNATLSNTDFSKATWTDGRQCAAASLGTCR